MVRSHSDTLRLRFGFFTWAPYVKLETKLEYPFIYHSLKRMKDINFLFPICQRYLTFKTTVMNNEK